MTLEIIILAAGKGSRMKSSLPKVLHTFVGGPILTHILRAADALNPDRIHVIIGHGAKQVKAVIDDSAYQATINWVYQHEQLGTGHAVSQAMPFVDSDSTVLIMNGDAPLIQPETLRPLCDVSTGVHLLTAVLEDANGLGRIVRDQAGGGVQEIVEHKDANEAQLAIREISTGLMAVKAKQLANWLKLVKSNNAQGEYYLPDIIALAVKDKAPVTAFIAADNIQVLGINSRSELAKLERHFQHQQAEQLLEQGIGLADPARCDIRGRLRAGKDCFIDINCVISGDVELGKNVTIGPNVVIQNSYVGDHCQIEANSVIERARIAENCQIGPFARIRPETNLQKGSKIGNFVEIKKSDIGEGSKVNHLSYVGDSSVGRDVNIGAGVITCNYDGVNKHQTNIGDGAFIGSDCQLIAPVSIGEGATIGAGSTIRKSAPAHTLSLSKTNQMKVPGWKRPTKNKDKT